MHEYHLRVRVKHHFLPWSSQNGSRWTCIIGMHSLYTANLVPRLPSRVDVSLTLTINRIIDTVLKRVKVDIPPDLVTVEFERVEMTEINTSNEIPLVLKYYDDHEATWLECVYTLCIYHSYAPPSRVGRRRGFEQGNYQISSTGAISFIKSGHVWMCSKNYPYMVNAPPKGD